MKIGEIVAPLEAFSAVREGPLLRDFGDEELGIVGSAMRLADYEAGENLCEQESEGDSMFILLLGQVGVRRKAKDKDRVRERILAVIGMGECVGEMGLADGSPRSATLVALEPTKAAVLTREAYLRLRESHPQIGIKLSIGIFRLLSKRIRQINNALETVHFWLGA